MTWGVRDGNSLQYAHTAAVKKGDAVFLDTDFVLVALNDGIAGETVAYGIGGAFNFDIASTEKTFAIGDKAYYNATKKTISKTATDKLVGRVIGIYDSVAEVKIN